MQGIESLLELENADFSINKIRSIDAADFRNNKKILELNLSYNPLKCFNGLKNLEMLETLTISNNKYLTDLSALPPLEILNRL